MGGNTIINQSAVIRQALASGKQIVIYAPTSIVNRGSATEDVNESLFRHFSKESLIRLNELLDDPDKPLPFLARLVYLMRLSTEGDRPRTQTEIAQLIGVTKQVVNHYFVEYFPQFCPRKSVKQIEAGA